MTDSEKLDLLLEKMGIMETKMGTMETKMGTMETKMGTMETKMSTMEMKMSTMETKMGTMETKMGTIETDVKDIRLTLENEIRVNIKRVAEGHLDLSRNLHEALKIDHEKEMLSIRVNMLESEVRRIKERLEQTA